MGPSILSRASVSLMGLTVRKPTQSCEWKTLLPRHSVTLGVSAYCLITIVLSLMTWVCLLTRLSTGVDLIKRVSMIITLVDGVFVVTVHVPTAITCAKSPCSAPSSFPSGKRLSFKNEMSVMKQFSEPITKHHYKLLQARKMVVLHCTNPNENEILLFGRVDTL